MINGKMKESDKWENERKSDKWENESEGDKWENEKLIHRRMRE